jgi:carotenoid cleavage dioxygenase-like enzyme
MKFLFLFFLLGYVRSLLNFKFTKFPKITGFFGLIGPNVDRSKTNSFFDLFIGDGIIYGVFIENGKITPITHLVETEKILYEKKNNKLSKKFMMMPFYILLNKLNLLPNIMGVANTAFLDNDIPVYQNKKNILTTCEMDKPYEIELDFNKKDIKTLSKVNTSIEHFSAHSKYDKNNKKIHSIDYNPVTNKVTYYELDNIGKNILCKNEFITKYSPNVHDFIIFEDNLIFIEPPLVWNFLEKIPLIFDKLRETYIIVYDLKLKKIEKYNYKDNGFFMFHYADIQKKDNNILEIYAPLYDNFSFSSLEIDGKYRKIIIDKKTKKITIEKNDELEKMNLDFPIKWKDYVLLLKFNNKLIDELVLCKKLDIIKNIKLPKNRYLCGEPQIVEYNFIPYVIGILFDSDDNGYFFSFDMFNIDNSYVEQKLDYKPNIGFHSIFVYK